MDSEEREICSRCRSRRDIFFVVVKGVYLEELVFYLRVGVVATRLWERQILAVQRNSLSSDSSVPIDFLNLPAEVLFSLDNSSCRKSRFL